MSDGELQHNRLGLLFLLLILLVPGITWKAVAQSGQPTCSADLTVKSGDTLRIIAQRCGTTIPALLQANPKITNPDLIMIGQVLAIPGQPVTAVTGSGTGDPATVTATFSQPSKAFAVTDQAVPLIGTVVVDPQVVKYWKIDIRSFSTRGFIGPDLFDRTPAFDWVTLGQMRTDTVTNGHLAVIPGWPTLSPGSWAVRLVMVGYDDTFIIKPVTLNFSVTVPHYDPVPIEITQPASGQVLTTENAVLGSIHMDQFAIAYQIELLGGSYMSWTPVDRHSNDIAHPTIIDEGQIGTLPPLSQLAPGQYRLRVVVLGFDSNYLQPPRETDFAIGSNESSNLAVIAITSPAVANGRINLSAAASLVGTVTIPPSGKYFKVEIKDAKTLAKTQAPHFTDWTTLGDMHTTSVTDGPIEFLAGPPAIPPGNYQLRIVVVGPEDQFLGNPYVVDLVIPLPKT